MKCCYIDQSTNMKRVLGPSMSLDLKLVPGFVNINELVRI